MMMKGKFIIEGGEVDGVPVGTSTAVLGSFETMRLLASIFLISTAPLLWAEPRRGPSQNARKPQQSPELAGKIEDSKHKHSMDTLEPDPAQTIFEVKPRNPIARTTATPKIKTSVSKTIVTRGRRAARFIDEAGVIHPQLHPVPTEYDLINEDFVQAEEEAKQHEEEMKLKKNALRDPNANTPPPPPVYTTRVTNDANVENPEAIEESLKVKHVKVPSSLFITDDEDEFEEDKTATTTTTLAPVTTTTTLAPTTTTEATTTTTTVETTTTTTVAPTVSTEATSTTASIAVTTTVAATTTTETAKEGMANFFDEVEAEEPEDISKPQVNLEKERVVKVKGTDIQFSSDDSVEVIGELDDAPERKVHRAEVIQVRSSGSANPEKRFASAKRLLLSNFVTQRYNSKQLNSGFTHRAHRSKREADDFSVDKHIQRKLQNNEPVTGDRPVVERYELRVLPELEPPKVAFYTAPPHLTTSIPGALQGFMWTAAPVLVPVTKAEPSTTTVVTEVHFLWAQTVQMRPIVCYGLDPVSFHWCRLPANVGCPQIFQAARNCRPCPQMSQAARKCRCWPQMSAARKVAARKKFARKLAARKVVARKCAPAGRTFGAEMIRYD
uniref:Mucin-5AC n=1 Tax=Bursaphelenchus xylophilus TaxID=6326 RepID=A0A1I7SRZ2_BURXY